MSSSVFSEAPSSRPSADGDSNLVVVYSKKGISFDERAIKNVMEEKSIASISVVRLTSPTPSMVDQEETERLEELERFLETATDREDTDADRDTDEGSQSGGEELISEKDHVTGDDNDNTGAENNDDSTENETEAPKIKKRPGRKPKPKKVKKRRKPKERPQIVGLSVDQFYADSSADLVVKNALKLAGLSLFKRTPESDALWEIIKNDHNYTPFTSAEQMKAQKTAEKLAMVRQIAQGRKFIVQTQTNVKGQNTKKRFEVVPINHVQAASQQPRQQPQQLHIKQLPRQLQLQQSPIVKQQPQQIIVAGSRPVRSTVKVINTTEDMADDDDDAANSSATADEENVDTEELSEPSDESRETDNDRDSDIDFKMNNSRTSKKRKRVKKLSKRAQAQPTRVQAVPAPKPPPVQPQFPNLKRRKEPTEINLVSPAIGQIVHLNTKAPPSVIALGRGIASTSFLKVRPTHKSLPTAIPIAHEATRLCTPTTASKLRRTPMVQLGRVGAASPGGFPTTPQSQDIKEFIINKNLTSPKGVFTNLNSLLADNNKATLISSPEPSKQRLLLTPNTPKTSLSALSSPAPATTKGFMPIGVETASSHKLPAQIVIETHQSSSELAAENDKQLDLIDSIVQDELLKASLVEQPPANADENIPKLAKMLESSAASLDQVPEPNLETVNTSQQNFIANLTTNATAESIDIASARLLDTADEDEITADFLQHVVGLIEEDKQFEAEVVKQVLASTETGGLDAIANAVAPQIFDTPTQLPIVVQPLPNEFPPIIVTSTLGSSPMACSTPAHSSSSTMSLASRAEVKVVRGNGRVIYLPPIEAPTTRAKRRAQNPATSSNTSDISNITLSETTLDSNQFINTSFDSDSNSTQAVGIARKQLSREPTARRPRGSNKPSSSQSNDADESQEDDDDPNKLWCICRQPHNNRFMICCDQCEDWYHGTCVSVTKAMGLEMEQKGIDWKCPNCVKKQEEKNQPRITDMLIPIQIVEPADSVTLPKEANESIVTAETQESTPKKSLPVAVTIGSLPTSAGNSQTVKLKRTLVAKTPSKILHQQQLHFVKLGSNSSGSRSIISVSSDAVCVVCKRPARASSVYCSDECIRKYAQSAIQAQTVVKGPEPAQQLVTAQAPIAPTLETKKIKKKDLFEDMLRQADSMSPKVERINVFERRSGRAITGHMAPSTQQLKKWLQDNPSFEVVQPGSQQAIEIEKRQVKRNPELTSPDTAAAKPFVTTPVHKPAETSNRSIQLLSTVPSIVKKEKIVVKASTNQKRSPERSNPERSINKSQPEPIRLSVRRTLKDQLLARIKEAQAADLTVDGSDWLTEVEVEHFVKRVESEMYHSFGRDVSAKYKAKYRSLMFNIKDRKNKTLFDKICAKQVEPKQLVRMTPAELASQELAKWREEENRHQLDMIKKSELDLLSRAQNYLVTMRKGEEAFKTKVDVTLPEEQLVEEATNEMSDSSDNKKLFQSHETTATDVSSKELDSERSFSKEKHSRSREKERSRERDRDKEKERDRRHKNHKNHHHSGVKRSRSRSSSRGRSIEKRSHKRQHHESEADKEKEQQKRDKQLAKERTEKVQSPVQKKPAEKKPEPALAFSLVDQILESEKTVEQAANLPLPTKPTLKSVQNARPAAKAVQLDKYARYLQKQPSPALWSGNLHMVDVTDFDVVIHNVLGNTNQLGELLPSSLDVIGRITRVNVWEYLKKIKKSPTKEIVIVNLFPAGSTHTANFDSFFEYLDSRQRLGVLSTDTEQIRDFYIFPLGTNDKLPSVLLTPESVPFYEDTERPNTLLGIIVRCLTKRLGTLTQSQPLPLPLPTAKNNPAKVSNKTRSRTTFTPPSSPKRKHSTHSTSSKDDEFDIDAIIKAPIAKLHTKNISAATKSDFDDPNAPYSPGGSSDDNDDFPSSTPVIKDDLERKVNEINKQIAAQRKEIAGLLKVESSVLDKPTSSSSVLANISIPPDLTKILASLKEKNDTSVGAQPSHRASEDEEYNPEDAITSNSSYGMESKHNKIATKTKSRLAQLSEAELLSMVPDNLVNLSPAKSTRNDEPPPPGV